MTYLEKKLKLPSHIKDFLESNDVLLDLETSCFLYGIKDNDIQKISKEIGLVFVGDFSLQNLPSFVAKSFGVPAEIGYGIAYEINKRIFNRFPDYFKDSSALLQQWGGTKSAPVISETEAHNKLLEAEPWIVEEEKQKREAVRKTAEEKRQYEASLAKMPFNEALQKYSAFGEQLITSKGIKLQGFPEPVRPSVKNWIADYTSTFGYEKNNPIKRNDYLFRSPNGQNLDQSDREKLSFVLKAFEENSTVSFNQDTKMLMFGKANALPVEPETSENNISFVPASQEKETIPQGEMSFSFPQKMPFEKTPTPQPIQPTQPVQSAPSATPKINTNPNIVKIPPKIITPPKNVVNLKDLQ